LTTPARRPSRPSFGRQPSVPDPVAKCDRTACCVSARSAAVLSLTFARLRVQADDQISFFLRVCGDSGIAAMQIRNGVVRRK
jgi:hypothetical protein